MAKIVVGGVTVGCGAVVVSTVCGSRGVLSSSSRDGVGDDIGDSGVLVMVLVAVVPEV
jgi:hypothetical protein